MNITFEPKEDLTGVLTITIQEADYKKDLGKKIRETALKANMKGFRPGKVPPALIEKMYGRSLKAEIIEEIIGRETQAYITSEKLNILGRPLLSETESERDIDWAKQDEFSFTFDLGLHSEVQLPDLSSVVLKEYTLKYSDEALDKIIDSLRRRHGKTSAPDETGDGDTIFGDLAAEGTESKYTGIPLSKVKPEALAQFLGKKPQDELTFVMEEAFADADARMIANARKPEEITPSGKHSFKIRTINRSELAELDADLYRAALPDIFNEFESPEAFRAALADRYEGGVKNETTLLRNRQIRDYLVENSTVNFSDDFLKRWLISGADDKEKAAEDVNTHLEQYRKSVKWDLVQNKASAEVDLKLTNTDIEHEVMDNIVRYFESSGVPIPDHEDLHHMAHNFLEKAKGEDRQKLINSAFEKKIFGHLASLFTFAEEVVNEEQFEELLSKQD